MDVHVILCALNTLSSAHDSTLAELCAMCKKLETIQTKLAVCVALIPCLRQSAKRASEWGMKASLWAFPGVRIHYNMKKAENDRHMHVDGIAA